MILYSLYCHDAAAAVARYFVPARIVHRAVCTGRITRFIHPKTATATTAGDLAVNSRGSPCTRATDYELLHTRVI